MFNRAVERDRSARLHHRLCLQRFKEKGNRSFVAAKTENNVRVGTLVANVKERFSKIAPEVPNVSSTL